MTAKRGGRRPGAGRPQTDRSPLNTVASPETRRRLAAIDKRPWRAIEIAAEFYEETKMLNEPVNNREKMERIVQIQSLDQSHRHYDSGYRYRVFVWSDDGTECHTKGLFKTQSEADDCRERQIAKRLTRISA